MTVLTGKISSFFTSYGASTPTTAEGMTRVGATNVFYITTRSKMWWDPEATVTVKIDGTATTVNQIDYGIGYVTLAAYTSGTVTCDVSYFAMEALGGGHGWKVDIKADTREVTTFPQTLNTSANYKQYVNTMMEFNGSVDRYWYTATGPTRHSWEIAAKMAGKCLLVFYVDVTTGTRRYFAGVGNLSGMSQTAEVGGIVESNLSFSGSGRLMYHDEG
jgi:hypothetical protein